MLKADDDHSRVNETSVLIHSQRDETAVGDRMAVTRINGGGEVYLICFLQVESIWRSTPGFSAQTEARLKQQWFGLDLSGLGFVQTKRCQSECLVMGIQLGDFQILKSHLESLLCESLPDIRPVLCEAPSDVPRSMGSYQAFAPVAQSIIAANRAVLREQKRSIKFEKAMKELARAYLSTQQRRKFLALDVEAYEFNHTVILEIGYTVATWRGSSFVLRDHHFIIEESLDVLNGVKVSNAKFSFNFGTSSVLPLEKAMGRLRAVLRSTDFLVGHAIGSDERFLEKWGINFRGKTIFDTQVLLRAMARVPDTWRLSRILDYCDINDYSNLHNAGNDAHYTMVAFLSLAMRGGKVGDGISPIKQVLRTQLADGSYLITPSLS